MASNKYNIQQVTLSAFYHSTEDPNKVRQALLNVVPKDLRSEVSFEESIVSGYYGNTIGILTLKFKSKKAEKVFTYVLCSLNATDKAIFSATLSNRVGVKNSIVFLRLSKQDAYLGQLSLMDGDDIIKLSATVKGVRTFEELKKYIDEVLSSCA